MSVVKREVRFYAKSMALCSILFAVGSGPASADTDISIAPRFWYFVDDFSTGGDIRFDPQSGTEFLSVSEPFNIPMYGASISIRTDFLPKTTFTLTGLTGKDEISRVTLGSNVTPTRISAITHTVEIENRRIDVELTAQTSINDVFSWAAGFRWERASLDFDLSQTREVLDTTVSPTVTTFSNERFVFEDGYDLYSVRGGLAGAVPITSNRRHLLYSNALAFVGYRIADIETDRFDDSVHAGPDISVGYIWSINERLTLDLRYRGLFFFPVTGKGEVDDPKATHGASIALSIRF